MSEQRLIDADAPSNRLYVSDFAIEAMKSIPTIDAAVVVHGEWKQSGSQRMWYEFDECSCCKFHTPNRSDFKWAKYCPSCGAKMDKGEEK